MKLTYAWPGRQNDSCKSLHICERRKHFSTDEVIQLLYQEYTNTGMQQPYQQVLLFGFDGRVTIHLLESGQTAFSLSQTPRLGTMLHQICALCPCPRSA